MSQPPASSSPSIDWDGAVDSYRKSASRQPSQLNRSSSPSMAPPVASPFHRPPSPLKVGVASLQSPTAPAPSLSSPSPTSGGGSGSGSSLKTPPPVPNQFKRGTSPSIAISPTTPTSAPSLSPSPLPHSPSSSPAPFPSPFPTTPVLSPPSPQSSALHATVIPSPSSTSSVSSTSAPAAPGPPLSSPPLSFLRSSNLAPVMSELRQVYQPFPAYAARPAAHSATPQAAQQPSRPGKLQVIATHKVRRAAKREREERKEQPAEHARGGSGAIVAVNGRPLAVDEEEKQAEDDEDDEDDPQFSEEQQRLTEEEDIARSWVEFIDPKSSTRVYINVRTGEMSWDRPAAMADEEDDEEAEDNRSRGGKQTVAGLRVENEEGSVVADELSDLFTLTSIPPARVLSSLRHIDSAMEQLLAKAVNLPPPLLASLSTARTQLTDSVTQLSAIVSSSERSPVETLIAYDTLPWSFSSSAASFASIDYYRASASLLHANDPLPFAPTSQHPVYFSSAPLPAHLRQYPISVRLHSEDDHSVPRFLTLTVGDRDSAVSVVKHCMYKGINRLTGERGGGAAAAGGWEGGVDNHVLKAVGSEEYMLGERPMFEYEYVRQRMRDGEDVQLVIVRKQPQSPQDSSADSAPLAVQYLKKVNKDIIPLSRTSYTNLSLRSPLASQPAFSTYDAHLPFRYKVCGLDHMSAHTLPQLASSYASYPTLVSFSLRSFLFHGTVRVADSNFSTPEQPLPCSSVRFGSWHTCPSVMLDSFPRGLRVAFLLYGKREDGKELMLAWLAKQLVDEGGEVLRGRRVFKLWSIKPDLGKKKHGKEKDDMIEANIYRATTADNECDRECVRLTVDFQDFALPLVYPLFPIAARPASKTLTMVTAPPTLAKAQQKQLDDILTKDALYPFTAADVQFIWQHRQHMTRVPHALPTFLQSVNWQLLEQRQEAHRLLREWTPFYSPLSALLLLDCKNADAVVREHAVTIIRRLSDDQLAQYLLQLVQCLKYEHYHHSPLSALLVQRAVASPIVIGQPLFWHLKNELHEPYHCERFVLVLEEMLSFCPLLCAELAKQVSMVSKLTKVSEMVQRLKRDGLHDHEVEKEYHKELHKLNADFFSQIGYFLSPLHPKKRCLTLVVEKCRYMSSKMVPLWLTFRNADPYTHQHSVQQHNRGSSHTVTAVSHSSGSSSSISAPTTTPHPAEYVVMMFKSGDDLRQDILTLQLLRYMDSTWLDAAIDLRLKPYAVVATGVNEHGDGIGLIDIVLNSETTSGIQLNPKYGGGTTGAFKLDPIDSFIRFHNKGNVAVVDAHTHEMTVKPAYELAVENFVHSCAGYCVATFVLGIGDRHNGNIMVTKRGHLFHIDFGHFLGNFKKKFGWHTINQSHALSDAHTTAHMTQRTHGTHRSSPVSVCHVVLCPSAGVNRERAAFVFTPEMAYVMGGSGYLKSTRFKEFLQLSKRAFKVLRQRVNELEMLFLLMCNAGMPELTSEQDIMYMRDKVTTEKPICDTAR